MHWLFYSVENTVSPKDIINNNANITDKASVFFLLQVHKKCYSVFCMEEADNFMYCNLHGR